MWKGIAIAGVWVGIGLIGLYGTALVMIISVFVAAFVTNLITES